MPRSPKLSILTDEVSQDLATVLRFAQEFALEGIEVRSLYGKAFRDLTPPDLREIRQRCDAAGLRISGAATPVFKCNLESASEIAEHRELFQRAVEAAHVLGCSVIRIFTFLRSAQAPTTEQLHRAAEQIRPLLEMVQGAELVIGIENEASCLAASGDEMRTLFGQLPVDPQFGVVWDPCNVLYLDGESDPVRDDYPLIAGHVCHLHVKDARRTAGRAAQTCVELGTGEVDFSAQLTALQQRGFDGWVTLETHWRAVALQAETQHLPAGYAFSAGAESASRICMAKLRRLLPTN